MDAYGVCAVSPEIWNMHAVFVPLRQNSYEFIRCLRRCAENRLSAYGVCAIAPELVWVHTAFAPFRWSHKIKSWLDFSSRDVSNEDERNVRRIDSLKSESTDNKQRTTGIHWYADILYSLAQVLMPERLRWCSCGWNFFSSYFVKMVMPYYYYVYFWWWWW